MTWNAEVAERDYGSNTFHFERNSTESSTRLKGIKNTNSETGKLGKEAVKANESLGDLNCWKSHLEETRGMTKAMESDKHSEWEEIRNDAGLLMGTLEQEIGNYGAEVDLLSMLRGESRGGEKDWNHKKVYKVDKMQKDSTAQSKKERD
ncbi:hypothetical protein FGLOB1_9713 [Fusarium globosum]|uniref:Uncharacterized protein n=1 Tax=Fusarium globosum TaxID=78864 RepID=A0A8H6D392_9HYPO|nr:hypothetical protein FGLOB1_9713 [Fusarium globosum]